MKATCPKCDSKAFIATAYVSEDWVVDEHGDFIEIADNPDVQVLHKPHPDNIWTCKFCGAEAKVEVE